VNAILTILTILTASFNYFQWDNIYIYSSSSDIRIIPGALLLLPLKLSLMIFLPFTVVLLQLFSLLLYDSFQLFKLRFMHNFHVGNNPFLVVD
jgi:hypothetical protein